MAKNVAACADIVYTMLIYVFYSLGYKRDGRTVSDIMGGTGDYLKHSDTYSDGKDYQCLQEELNMIVW